jgi:hypothetical protein
MQRRRSRRCANSLYRASEISMFISTLGHSSWQTQPGMVSLVAIQVVSVASGPLSFSFRLLRSVPCIVGGGRITQSRCRITEMLFAGGSLPAIGI